MRLLDCTLRDGANVAGLGFTMNETESMIQGMIACGITEIEYGNAHGIGCNEKGSPVFDTEYLTLAEKYKNRAQLGMFLQSAKATEEIVAEASQAGLSFLRVGNIVGKGTQSEKAIRLVKKYGLSCRYSMMRVYILSPEEASEEARELEKFGIDEITLMDSAGTMMPDEVASYVQTVKNAVSIPVGFHAHNNLGLACANALAAMKHGADSIDTCLMGMGRSAGNCPTEIMIPLLQKYGLCKEMNVYPLLSYIDEELMEMMVSYHYSASVPPKDLIYGLSGCHSNVAPRIEKEAEKNGVSAYELVMEVSRLDKISPSEELILSVARKLQK